ncbi:MAG: OmpA family protein [Bacteroidota bacterium]
MIKYSLFLSICLLVQIGFAQPESLGDNINTTYDEILPVISPDEKTIYFIRANHPQNSHGETGSQDIWFSQRMNASADWGPAKRMPNPFNKRKYNSIYTVSPDGNQIVIAGSYKNGRYMGPGVSISKRNGRVWSSPVSLQIKNYDKLANGKFSSAFMSYDNKVLLLSFCSKKSGKQSKKGDLYVSFKQQNNVWSEPVSLGKNINYPSSSEFSPFLGADLKTLFFASDRKGGEGSVDIYKTVREDDSWKKWSDPVNLGPKVNTEGFDAYYSISASGEYAYMVKYEDQADIVRMALSADQRPKPVALLMADIVDDKTGEKVKSSLVIENAETGRAMRTIDQTGRDGIKTILQLGRSYRLVARASGYTSKSLPLDLSKENLYKEIKKDIRLVKPDPTAELAANGKGANGEGDLSEASGQSTGGANAGKGGNLASDASGAGNGLATGNQGANGQGAIAGTNAGSSNSLGGPNAGTTKPVKVDDGIDSKLLLKDRLITLDPNEKLTPMPLKDIGVTPLFFETRSAEINPAYNRDLYRIYLSMKANPKMRLVIKGHADDVGAEDTNQNLSETRAESVKGRLISLGVPPNRMKTVGYGEDNPIMENSSNLGRGVNRRVDFQVIAPKKRKK